MGAIRLRIGVSMNDYIEKRRRNQVKKQLRRTKPYLMGQQLDIEVDKVLGISDSGVMDWAAIQKVAVSDYPTPESITPDLVRSTAKKFGVRPYLLHWVFIQKINKLSASGRTKADYLAVLKECVLVALKKQLTDQEKIIAVVLFSEFAGTPITRLQAEIMLDQEEL